MDLTLFAPAASLRTGRDARRLADTLERRGMRIATRLVSGTPRAPRAPGPSLVLGLSALGDAARATTVIRGLSGRGSIWPTLEIVRRLASPSGLRTLRRALAANPRKVAPTTRDLRRLEATHGTTSLFAFGGIFSHALRHGSVADAVPVFASTYELLLAHHAIEAADARGVVVRVDLVHDAESELHLLAIDPSPAELGFGHFPEGVERLADVIVRRFQRA